MAQKNATKPVELARAEDLAKQQAGDLQFVLDDPRGRRFLWDLLGECGVYRLSFEASGSMTMFKEGQRSIGLNLTARMTDMPDLYLTMQQEAIDRARLEDERVNRETEE